MKSLGLGLAALLLAGCATTNGGYQASSKYEVDWDKVNTVERASQSGSVHNRVIWVNPPVRKKSSEEEEDRNNS